MQPHEALRVDTQPLLGNATVIGMSYLQTPEIPPEAMPVWDAPPAAVAEIVVPPPAAPRGILPWMIRAVRRPALVPPAAAPPPAATATLPETRTPPEAPVDAPAPAPVSVSSPSPDVLLRLEWIATEIQGLRADLFHRSAAGRTRRFWAWLKGLFT